LKNGKVKEIRYGVLLGGYLREASIICTDGETHAERFVGPSRWTPKLWKTLAGAQRAADRYNGGDPLDLLTGKKRKYKVYVVEERWGAYPPAVDEQDGEGYDEYNELARNFRQIQHRHHQLLKRGAIP